MRKISALMTYYLIPLALLLGTEVKATSENCADFDQSDTQAIDEYIAKMRTTYRQLKWLHVIYHWNELGRHKQSHMEVSREIWLDKSAEQLKYRDDQTKTKTLGNSQIWTKKMTAISDGEYLFRISQLSGVKQQSSEPKIVRHIAEDNARLTYELLLVPFPVASVKYKRLTQLSDGNTVIETCEYDVHDEIRKTFLYNDETGTIKNAIAKWGSGRTLELKVSTTALTNPIDQSLFDYSPPVGADYVDESPKEREFNEKMELLLQSIKEWRAIPENEEKLEELRRQGRKWHADQKKKMESK